MSKSLAFAAIAEAVTGLTLVIAPSLVARLLFGTELEGVAIPIARVTGIALIGLSVACWHGHARLGMVIYGGGVMLYFLYLALAGQWVGPFLWPAITLHAGMTAWCALQWRPKSALD